jgi:hypothetical protein
VHCCWGTPEIKALNDSIGVFGGGAGTFLAPEKAAKTARPPFQTAYVAEIPNLITTPAS